MNRILTATLVLIVTTGLFMAACEAQPPASPSPKLAQDQALIMIIERVQGLAQTYEAKEYVALLFPPPSSESEYDEELRAWEITITAFPPEAREGFVRAEWFKGDVDEHFSSFRESEWVVFDYGRIVPMGGAFMIEADIERLNMDKKLPVQLPPTPTPIPKPTPTPVPAPMPAPAPAPAPTPITVHLLAVLHSRYDSIADLPDKAKIGTIHGQQEPRLETALATYGTSFELLIIPSPEWYEALKRPVDAVLVKSHPSPYLQKYIASSEVLLLPWNSKAVTAVIDSYPETTILARLPANTYEGQTKSILGYAPAN